MAWQAKIDSEKKWNFLNTGLSSIRLLLEFEINSLTIYGFTFYKGGRGYVQHQDDVIRKIAEENPLNGMHYEPSGKSHQQHKQKRFSPPISRVTLRLSLWSRTKKCSCFTC